MVQEYALLIIDKDHESRRAIRQAAEVEGMEVHEVDGGAQALRLIEQTKIDIIVIDVSITDMDGFEFCKESCRLKNIPILIHTAYGDEFIKMFAYNQLGISDYVIKPCSPQEIIARLRVILRHRANSTNSINDDVLRAKGLLVYKRSRFLYVDNQKTDLTPKEFDLLTYFMEHTHHVLSREQILKDVWGYDFYGSDRTVDTHVKRLRDRLGSYRDYIVTTHRVGYQFDPK